MKFLLTSVDVRSKVTKKRASYRQLLYSDTTGLGNWLILPGSISIRKQILPYGYSQCKEMCLKQ